MIEIPKLKKKINSFLIREEGKISKEKLIKTGILLSAVAIASVKSVEADCPKDSSNNHDDHCNELGLRYEDPISTATGTHNHGHGNHSSHGSGGGGGC